MTRNHARCLNLLIEFRMLNNGGYYSSRRQRSNKLPTGFRDWRNRRGICNIISPLAEVCHRGLLTLRSCAVRRSIY